MRRADSECPFCAATLRARAPRLATTVGAMAMGLALSACGSDDKDSSSDTVADPTAQPAYGVPATDTFDPTATTMTATDTDGGSSSTGDTDTDTDTGTGTSSGTLGEPEYGVPDTGLPDTGEPDYGVPGTDGSP